MIYFLDASALVKKYVDEPGSKALRALLRRPRRRVAVSRLSMVEVASALWRRAREGTLPIDEARRSTAVLAADLLDVDVVEIRPAVVELAASLIASHPLRAYDAVQLGSALRLCRDTGLAVSFACADGRLARVARLEGLRIVELA